ncbi:MAG TPA: hypothetical protein ENK10_07590, partial [Acidobacteria bacterium]|nr:hypothetical protein [Acidobacteriota bacterium]
MRVKHESLPAALPVDREVDQFMSTIDIGHFPIMRFRQAFMALIGFGLVTAILVYLAVENEGTDAYLVAAAGMIV